ncbi:hypothetical protein lacNasYZ03_17670 [Lactobacillus nasalidis]|uniref:Uncharacterized protein n=1 Tax=Lactobacillus nasalidis TaxID=2797258 RepID=A0ABQ3W9H7_9LACO|nr:hypothetical protein [Lactobacillus nasalidis]GHV97675.1 hypothetical protein lacNasYZ01_08570 [Lactobacillus nasalidis]GHV99115.1 hypothetical protein lacNasYZ02_05450 [Lactobacillus nasalidis]GHW02080.1 hypothetical protein lacNasYZ03_17670 [Lactobacillus nasalidis]
MTAASYSRDFYQGLLKAGRLEAREAASYRLGPGFILAYDLGPAAAWRTLVVDRNRGELLVKKSTKALLAAFINQDLPGGYPLQKKLCDLLEIKEQHVISAGHGAIFSPSSLHAPLVDLVALQQMRQLDHDQGCLALTDLAGNNRYLFETPRGYARARQQLQEAVEHNALYCALFHGLAGRVGCPACSRLGDWNLLYAPRYQQAVEAVLAEKGLSLRGLLAEIREEKRLALRQLLVEDMALPLLAVDLDYALKEVEKKFSFKI